jgi:hypothetical protein
MWGYQGFKAVETYVMPVITDVRITEMQRTDENVRIRGTFNRHRGACVWQEMIAYSENYRVDLDLVSYSGKTRNEGMHNWGWWEITPAVDRATVYIRYSCPTGSVMQKAWEGLLRVSR